MATKRSSTGYSFTRTIQLIKLQRWYSQLTRRVVILENILIQQFGKEVVASGECIVKMLDSNLEHLKSRLTQPKHHRRRIKTNYVKDEPFLFTTGPLLDTAETENFIKVEPSDDNTSDNENKCDVDYIPEAVETSMTSESEFEGDNFHDQIPDKEDSNNSEPHHERVVAEKKVVYTDRKSVPSDHLLKLKSRLKAANGSSAAKPFKCVKCGIYLRRAYNLRLHMLLHRSDEKYKCEFCSKGFRTEFLRSLHLKSHSEERPFKCNQCELAFSTISKLKLHLRFHNPEDPFGCTTCEKRFKTQSALTRHDSSHQQLKPYPCPKCEQRFYTSSHTRRHLRNVHKCLENFKIEKDPEFVKNHEVIKVPRKPRIIAKKFKERKERRRERGVCHLCGASVIELKQHLRIHETPFNCTICGKVFKSKFAMDFHQMQVHLDDKRPFHCNQPGCDARFTQSSTLRHHRLTHSTTRRYSCHICFKAYKHSSGLRLHKISQHSDAPPKYPCMKCSTPKSFYSSSHLSRHLRTVHASERSNLKIRTPVILQDENNTLVILQDENNTPVILQDETKVEAEEGEPLLKEEESLL